MPRGSEAQKFELGMPAASRPASGLAFQGIDQLPTRTSGTSWPVGVGSDHFQQNPPVNLAVEPSLCRWRMSRSSSWTESTMQNSNGSRESHMTLGVRRICSVLSTQLMNASDPLQQNCASNSNSYKGTRCASAASRIRLE